MAIALTLGIESGLSNAISAYFTKFKVLPPKNVIVSQTKILTGVNSFETLLKGIIAEKATTDFVIVVHGHDDGNGLFLKLASSNGKPIGPDATQGMLQILMDINARPSGKATAAEKTSLAPLSDADITRLIGHMKTIRDKKLGSVEFRGCNLGKNPVSVSRFREFLGAKTFGAPNLHSFFGKFPTKTGSSIMGSHSKTHAGDTFSYPASFVNKNCNCCIGVNDHKKPHNGHIVADDDNTLDLWIKANFDATNSLGKSKDLPIHGLWEIRKAPPKDPSAIDPPPRPIFPLAKVPDGKNKVKFEYADHMVYKP